MLKFNRSSDEAEATVTWEGQRVSFPVGLDGVERFTTTPLIGLPQAAKGEWQNSTTFLLDLDLVGGINHYRITLTFADEGKKVNVALHELTGLSDEQFTGIMSE